MFNAIDKLAVDMVIKTAQGIGGPPGVGASPAASPLASPAPGMQGGGAMMPASPGPGAAGPLGGPAGGPVPPPKPGGAPGGPQPAETTPGGAGEGSGRETEVRQALENLRNSILELGQRIYEIPLTEEQVKDIGERMLQTFSDRVNEITVDRVIDIGHDLIGGGNKPYDRKRRR